MLTGGEKDRIRLEEVYRREVQLALSRTEPAPGLQKRVWTFLNSAVGIFLLSTVVVGGLSWSYAKWDESRHVRRKTEQQAERLVIEIAGRVRFLDRNCCVDISWKKLYDLDFVFDGMIEEWLPRPSFPEFKERSLASLMWELSVLVPEDERVELRMLSESAYLFGDVLKESIVDTISVPKPEAAEWRLDSERSALLRCRVDQWKTAGAFGLQQ